MNFPASPEQKYFIYTNNQLIPQSSLNNFPKNFEKAKTNASQCSQQVYLTCEHECLHPIQGKMRFDDRGYTVHPRWCPTCVEHHQRTLIQIHMPSIPKLVSAPSLSLIEVFQLQYRRGLMAGRVSIQDWDLKEDPPARKLVPTVQGGILPR
jgi:hypothetical protein